MTASSTRVSGLLYGADELVADWVNLLCGGAKPGGPYVAIGYFRDGAPVAGVIFYNHQDRDISMALAVKRRCLGLRGALRAALAYPFGQLGLDRVTAEIDASNETSLEAMARLGGKLEGVKVKAAADGGNRAIYGLYRERILL